jgi:hypothetical protein
MRGTLQQLFPPYEEPSPEEAAINIETNLMLLEDSTEERKIK